MLILTTPTLILIAVILAALLLILSNRLRSDVIALLVLLVLGFTQVVTAEQALAGFSNPAIATIIGLFIISAGLENTGVIQWLAERLRKLGADSEGRLVILFMAAGATLSLFMNNIAAGAVLLPAATQVAREARLRASKLLIPLSFGTLVGGMATYFTTANIVLSGLLEARGLDGLSILDFLPVGGVITLAALIYMAFIGRHQIPARESVGLRVSPNALSRSLEDTYQLKERMWEVRIPDNCRLAGLPLSDSEIGNAFGITVLAVWHGSEAILTPEPSRVIHAGDYLLVLGREERVRKLETWGAVVGRDNGANTQHRYAVDLTEVIIPPRSSAIGNTLKDLRFRNRYGLTTVALWREGRSYRTDVGTFPLQVGDALLMVGSVKAIHGLAQDRDFIVLQSSHRARPPVPHKAIWALLITLLVLLIAIFELFPIAEIMLAGAVAMVLTGCLTMDDAYKSVEWRVIFLIAGMTTISTAMINTGLGNQLGEWIIGAFAPLGPLAIVGGIFLITMLLTQILAGQVAAIILGPIALSAALAMNIDPQAVAVATAIACSTAFLLPTAHPVNVLMMGPGGYRASDFFRVGIGMTLVTFVMLVLGMWLFWGIGR
jgi:di/tricarboxylate transporter